MIMFMDHYINTNKLKSLLGLVITIICIGLTFLISIIMDKKNEMD